MISVQDCVTKKRGWRIWKERPDFLLANNSNFTSISNHFRDLSNFIREGSGVIMILIQGDVARKRE